MWFWHNSTDCEGLCKISDFPVCISKRFRRSLQSLIRIPTAWLYTRSLAAHAVIPRHAGRSSGNIIRGRLVSIGCLFLWGTGEILG